MIPFNAFSRFLQISTHRDLLGIGIIVISINGPFYPLISYPIMIHWDIAGPVATHWWVTTAILTHTSFRGVSMELKEYHAWLETML